ncbi:hypothetical protein HDV05_004876 [Chytridiales sp. JEL 0842]|nr:hypothetical protein HDV05_004876 [Chytridiales sp. JEL 0842]
MKLTSFGLTLTALITCCSSSLAQGTPKTPHAINLAFVLPYALDDTVNGQIVPNSVASNVIANDAAAELAVRDVNSDPSLLPTTNVNIIRVNNWEPAYAKNNSLIHSGGYSIIESSKIVNTSRIAGAFGDYFDRTTQFTGEVFSYFKIPFCGATQTSSIFSSKSNYPYFFRMQPGTAIGPHVLQLMLQWNITRVSILTASDDVNVAKANSIQQTLANSNITVISKMIITPDMQVSKDFSYPMSILQTTDVRYFIITGPSSLVADLYFTGRDNGLVGSQYVWMGINPPHLGSNALQSEAYGWGATGWDLQGFVWIKADINGPQSPAMRPFVQRWKTLNAQNATKYPLVNDTLPPFAAQSYDCIKLMLLGFDRVLKSNGNYTPSMLSDPARPLATDVLPGAAFANTGYSGLLHNPISLDSKADLTTPYMFITLSGDSSQDLGALTSAEAFATTDPKGANLTLSTTVRPLFMGGDSTPPLDGSQVIVPTERLVASSSPLAKLIQALSIIGYIIAGVLTSFVVYTIVTKKTPIGNPASYMLMILVGSVLVFVSMNFWIDTETSLSCRARGFLLPIGYAATVSPIFAKIVHLVRHKQNKYERARGIGDIYTIAIALPVTILAGITAVIWNAVTNPQPILVTVSKYEYIFLCSSEDSSYGNYAVYILYAIPGLLLLICLNVSNSLKNEPEMRLISVLMKISTLEVVMIAAIPWLSTSTTIPRIVRAIATWFLSVGVLGMVIFPEVLRVLFNYHVDSKDDSVIHSLIMTKKASQSFKSEIGSVEATIVGQVFYQTRGLLGWSEARKADLIVHKRGAYRILCFSEVNTHLVENFTIVQVLPDSVTSFASSGGGSKSAGNGSKKDISEGTAGSEMDTGKTIVLFTKSFALKVFASSHKHAQEIRAHITEDQPHGGVAGTGLTGGHGTGGTGGMANQAGTVDGIGK